MPVWDHLRQDIRYAIRLLAKTPSWTALAALTVGLAQFGRPAWRAAMFGASAAIMFAFTAALIKQVTADFNDTPISFLTQWHVYAMALTGLVAVFLTQNAFHAGPVTASPQL